MSVRYPMTPQGEQKLREELADLKQNQRPAVINAISEAREHGDLKENAEYHAAREQQGFIEGRITELEAKLGNAQVIDVTTINQTGRVVFGVTVELEDVQSGETFRYKIVGEDEADINANMISIGSPIAKGLIGKDEGDEVEVQTPGGAKTFEIVEVIYE